MQTKLFRVPLVIIHGGAGKINKGLEPDYVSGVKEAAERGFEALTYGTALDAVEAAVMAMEDNPLFNAG